MSSVAVALSWLSGVLLGLPGWAIALIVGLGGAANAWAFYVSGAGWGPIVVELIVLLLVATVAGYGVGRLPRDPVTAVRAMDGLGIVIVIAGALGVFAGVAIAIAFTLPKAPTEPSTELTEVTKAISAALAAAVTAAIVKVAQEDADKWVAERVQKRFEEAYKDAAKTNENLRKALYLDADMGLTGWGRDERLKRAEAIAQAL